MRTYISLDIETTGFDAQNDQVIEIAAIKFKDGEIIDTYQTLINPQIPLPPIITHLTGIRSKDLEFAPSYDQIREKLVEFIGTATIIGHNISFDITFLNQKGLGLMNDLYDTLQLAGILLPGLSSYSLDTITRSLKITHTNKHRAYDDALACFELFKILAQRITELDEGTLALLNRILEKSPLPYAEFFGVKQKALSPDEQLKGPSLRAKNPKPSDLLAEIDYLGFYDDGGPLSKVIKHYEARPTQKQMSAKILEAFSSSFSLLVEAGTGTGKTMAYLLPAIYYGLKNQEQVIVSTYTKNLQEQIMDKDIPLIQKALHSINPEINITCASLKGRRNYLSTKRLEIFLQKDYFEEHEAIALMKIIVWLTATKTGNFEELSLMNKEFAIIDEVCCAEYVCPHDDPLYANACWLIRARKQAENANIVVVNHALLLQNGIAEKPLLPEPQSRYLIIDEAHHLERVTTESLTVTLSFHPFIRPFERLQKTIHDFKKLPADLFNRLQDQDQLGEVRTTVLQNISRIEIMFGLLGIFIERNLDPAKFQYQMHLKPYHLDTADWAKVSDTAKSIIQSGKEFINILIPLLQFHDTKNPYVKQMFNYLYECEKRVSDLASVFSTMDAEKQVLWLFKSPEGNITLKSAPYSVADAINNYLFADKKSVILTSATLRTDKNFSFMRDQLSLGENFEELVIPSHFDFPEQVKIIIPNDLPEPNTEGYFLNCADIIKKIVTKNRGRTLVLFTAKKALTATYMQIAPILKEEGINILAQGVTGSRGKILEQFKDEPEKSAIFGTDSFWEGVDLKGNMLTCVIMLKLPFDPPDDPIIQARSQKYTDSFSEFQIPRAILKFKQGFGRLIRSRRDTGSIVILDTRIIQKGYGMQFLNSLPEGIKIEYGSKYDIEKLL